MEAKLLMGIILSISLIYEVIVMIYWDGDGSLEHRPRLFQYTMNNTDKSTARIIDDVNRSLVHGPGRSTMSPTVSSSGTIKKKCLWKILFWEYPHQTSIREHLKGHYYCPETECSVEYIHSSSYDDVNSSHVIVLQHVGKWDIGKINSIRRADQILAYMTWESAMFSSDKLDSQSFNWTMTYSAISEVWIPYGWFRRNSPIKEQSAPRTHPIKNWAEGKKGLAIWIVSNCLQLKWPRLNYTKTLANFMKIDIFGRCGSPCGFRETCYKRIDYYKFYIAFENALCEDYITEKFWRNAYEHDAVPIVYGAPKSSYERQAPRNSFIHISDFSNMSSLAAYIDLLDENDTLYNEYFEWKLDYHVEQIGMGETATRMETLCSISERLVNLKEPYLDNSGSVERFKDSCGDVPRPGMV